MAPPFPQTRLSSLTLLPLISLLVLFKVNPQPMVLVLPVSKHDSTLQYVTRIHQRTPLVPLNVVVHLGGRVLWVACGSNYVSSTYQKAHCGSTQCALAHATGRCKACLHRPAPWCHNGTCTLLVENVFTRKASMGDISGDVLSLPSANGSTTGSMVSIPQILFSCAPEILLDGLAGGAKGMIGLSHAQIGALAQLSPAPSFGPKFAICLPPSIDSKGVIFLGDGPYILTPGIDVSKILTYTPLIIENPPNMATEAEPSSSYEYIIGVKSIRINGRSISFNSSSSSLDRSGMVRAKISIVDPYAVLETPIYNSLTEHFVREAMAANATRVASVAPFGVCFGTNTGEGGGGLVRPSMPTIDLMLHDDEVFWRIFETNSMVSASDEASCLAFFDGGRDPKTSIVIGGHQLEDNLVQFDMVSSRLGFTSSLLLRQTSCANFDFASG